MFKDRLCKAFQILKQMMIVIHHEAKLIIVAAPSWSKQVHFLGYRSNL